MTGAGARFILSAQRIVVVSSARLVRRTSPPQKLPVDAVGLCSLKLAPDLDLRCRLLVNAIWRIGFVMLGLSHKRQGIFTIVDNDFLLIMMDRVAFGVPRLAQMSVDERALRDIAVLLNRLIQLHY